MVLDELLAGYYNLRAKPEVKLPHRGHTDRFVARVAMAGERAGFRERVKQWVLGCGPYQRRGGSWISGSRSQGTNGFRADILLQLDSLSILIRRNLPVKLVLQSQSEHSNPVAFLRLWPATRRSNDQSHRPMRFTGSYHPDAIMRFPVLPHLLDSQDSSAICIAQDVRTGGINEVDGTVIVPELSGEFPSELSESTFNPQSKKRISGSSQ